MLKKSLSTQMISFIDYLRIITRANYFITALNTNALIRISDTIYKYSFIGRVILYNEEFILDSIGDHNLECTNENPTSPASFLTLFEDDVFSPRYKWCKPTVNSTLINGFFAACTPLEGLLKSTLDCLYDIECLHLLTQYFSDIQKVYLVIIFFFFIIIVI